jgi:hypothetical protein
MIQFNLCNNDIIIILVLFIVFCIFLYMTNTTSKNEHFENITPLVTSNEVKEKYKTSFENFFVLFKTHTASLKNLNDNYITIISNFNSDNDNDNIRFTIKKINSDLIELKTDLIKAEENLDLNLDVDKEFNLLYKNIKEIFKTHLLLFETPSDNDFINWSNNLNEDGTSNSNSNIDNCNKLNNAIGKDADNIIKYFYYNLNNKLDVIEAKNIGQLNLIKINIDNIKSITNKLNFNKTFQPKLIGESTPTEQSSLIAQKNKGAFDFYYEIINNMYNKNSVNIFNIIDTHTKCLGEDNYDNYKLVKNNMDLQSLNSSFEELGGKLKYYVIDEIFIKKINTPEDHFIQTKAGLKLWQSFCENLKKLNKPNKKNLILKKFNIDLIEKKTKYIKQLEDEIFNIQNKMNDNELQAYDINRLRTNDQATKQYEAIKKGIDNIKNRNKIKINLT